MSDQKSKWYIVKCPTGVEKKFTIEFQDALEKNKHKELLEEFFVPVISQQKSTSRKAIMANYIFVKMFYNDIVEQIFQRIKYASVMTDHNLKAVEVDEATVQSLKEKDLAEKEKLESKLEVGEVVKILEAPFVDFEGKIEKIQEKEEIVSVSILILGNPILIELPFTAIKRINS